MLASHFAVGGVGPWKGGQLIMALARLCLWLQQFVNVAEKRCQKPIDPSKQHCLCWSCWADRQAGRQAVWWAGREWLRIMIEKPLKQAGQRGVCVMCQLVRVRDGDEDEDEDEDGARAASLRPSVLNMRLDMQMFGQST